MGRGIEMIRDVEAYKEKLMTKKDKWGESALKPEEVKQALLEPDLAKVEGGEQAATTTETTCSGKDDGKAPVTKQQTNLINLVK